MSGIATAIVGGAVISGVVGSSSASKAAKAQGQSTDAAITEQRRQFDITEQRLQEAEQFGREQLQPFQQAGVSALESQQALVGLGGKDAQQQAFAGLAASPGQQFLQDRAQKNLLRNSAAIGGLGGGNVRSALVQQGVGFAQQDLQNQFGRLGQIAGQGQSAATNVASGAQNTASNIGQFGSQASGNISNALIASGDARASGILGQNQAFQQGLSGVATGLAQGGLFSPSTGTTLPAQNINPFARTV